MTKRALLIGFNYPNSGSALSGCWNDAKNVKTFLLGRGYLEANVTLVSDDSSGQSGILCSTKGELLGHLLSFVEKAQKGDILFFHYSGHGGQTPDKSKDESDGRDECIYTPDLNSISDDDLRKILVDVLPAEAVLISVFDCCHSGTILDLPYCKRRGGYRTENKNLVKNSVFCISACTDSQTAADTSFDKMPQGALTHAFLEVANAMKPGKGTWVGLVDQIIDRTKYFTQVAQLSYSKNLAGFDKMF